MIDNSDPSTQLLVNSSNSQSVYFAIVLEFSNLLEGLAMHLCYPSQPPSWSFSSYPSSRQELYLTFCLQEAYLLLSMMQFLPPPSSVMVPSMKVCAFQLFFFHLSLAVMVCISISLTFCSLHSSYFTTREIFWCVKRSRVSSLFVIYPCNCFKYVMFLLDGGKKKCSFHWKRHILKLLFCRFHEY